MTTRADSHRPEFHREHAWKHPVRVATTANVTILTALNSGDSIDGVSLVNGDRVLVKNQSTPSQNGIYDVSFIPARSYDMDSGLEALGALVYVIAGTANGGKLFKNTNTTVPTIDTDGLTFAEITGGGGGAPTTVDYLVGTADAGLSAEIVVGTTPGGELGGTWGSPTVDGTHSGSTHSAASDTHIADTTAAHVASSIGFTPAGTIAATTVQAAIEEVATEAGSISDITDLPTAETDDTLVLAPDGAGGVEWRPETGGGLSDPTTTAGDIIYRAAATDFALAGTATASDTTSSFVAANAIDGNDGTWHIHSSSSAGVWLKVDLGSAQLITDYRLGSTGGVTNRVCAAYDLESSPDDSTWTVRYTATGMGMDSGIVAITPVSFRYWRVIATGTAGSPDPWAQGTFSLFGGGGLTRLPIGTTGQVLTVSAGGEPEWA